MDGLEEEENDPGEGGKNLKANHVRVILIVEIKPCWI